VLRLLQELRLPEKFLKRRLEQKTVSWKALLCPKKKKMQLHLMQKNAEADAFFPELNKNIWKCEKTEAHESFSVFYYTRNPQKTISGDL